MTDQSFLKKLRKKATTLTATAGVLVFVMSGCSSPTAASSTDAATASSATTTAVGLFDTETAHEVSIEWDDADYATMIAAYESDSDKAWISADITIDGTLIENVGVRLKGNSTLRTLGGADSGPGGGAGAPAGGGVPPEGMVGGGALAGVDGAVTPPEGMEGGGAPAGTAPEDSTPISADDPASLPLLIRFDKYVDGAEYEGLTELALRPGSPVVNEALALSLTAATGQTSQRYAYTTYSVNGSETQTRLLLENPDEEYAENLLDGNSVLFKADSESSFTYQGDDLATYEDQFKQLNKTDTQDATPIVDFLKWLQNADDATFEDELANWVEVDSFATYAATQNLLANADDMTGAGQNYYLSYDLTTKKFSVISWDLNEALTNNATATPDTVLTMGGKGAGTSGDTFKSRFLASTIFKKIYDSAYQKLYSQIFADGTAASLLTTITAAIPGSDALTEDDIAEQSAVLSTFLEERDQTIEAALTN